MKHLPGLSAMLDATCAPEQVSCQLIWSMLNQEHASCSLKFPGMAGQ